MRKLVALVVCAVLLLSCCASLGEGLDIKPEDITADFSKIKKIDVELSTSALADKAGDIVSRNGYVYTVVSGDVTFELDLEKFPGVLCFTQDIVSSIEAYSRVDNYQQLAENLINDGVNFVLMDLDTGLSHTIYLEEADNASTIIDNFSGLTKASQETVAPMFGSSGIVKAGDLTWMKGPSLLMTIVHGKYLWVEYSGTGDAEADLQDTLDILSNLKVK